MERERQSLTEKLKPCPFCSCSAESLEEDKIEAFFVCCSHCGSSSPYADSEVGAIAAWNRRAREEALEKELERGLDLFPAEEN